MPDYSVQDIHSVAIRMRRHILTMATYGKTSHVGSALSCVEILAVLYFRLMNVSSKNWLTPEANRFILSKGHGAKAWYAVLAEAGFISLEDLDTYAQDGTYLGEHPSHCHTPGIGLSTGSLGHGLAVGAGQAWPTTIYYSRAGKQTNVHVGSYSTLANWQHDIQQYALNSQ